MRFPKDHKEKARRRLLEHGGSHAKTHGFGSSGMDALAAAAGVTTGSLYKHFDGKSDLFAAVVQAELQRTAGMYRAIAADDPEAATKSLAAYLSIHHVSHPEQGCMLPSLTPEVARADESVRAAFQAGLLEIHAAVERLTGASDEAWALVAQNVGAIMIARAMLDEKVQRELLAAARREGQALLNKATGVNRR
ncbi:MAG: TetR/AcrR family transcriptional regulator, transcriptional repressor for nem operon [Pseudomonadota bacterium]|nr:TetR/AcrR family transcriptional regulator, transcriptional repressor for nem operon [Pseudomonadota bacterium]